MPKTSAGLLMYRIRERKPEFLLVHPGGPFWKNKDTGAWSIPKGQVEENEKEFETAKREFEEETGIKPAGDFRPLQAIRQKSGKIVKAWAFEGDTDPNAIKSEVTHWGWPEIDRAGFFKFEDAAQKINPAQVAFLEEILNSFN